MKILCSLCSLLVIIFLLISCGPGHVEAGSNESTSAGDAGSAQTDGQRASATILSMRKLVEMKDWGGYVDQFYGESHKFRGPEDRDMLVSRFVERWGTQVENALRQALTLTPVIDEQGRAVFNDANGETVFMLYKHEDGRWTFHL